MRIFIHPSDSNNLILFTKKTPYSDNGLVVMFCELLYSVFIDSDICALILCIYHVPTLSPGRAVDEADRRRGRQFDGV